MKLRGDFVRPIDLSGSGQKIVRAIVSSTILPSDGVYRVHTLRFRHTDRWDRHSLSGIVHHMGHISTRQILERLGSKQAPNNMYRGQEVGDIIVSVSIRPGAHPRRFLGRTAEAMVTMSHLMWRRITRLE